MSPGAIMAIGPIGLAGAMACVPTPAGPWACAAAGGLVGLVAFAGIAWAVRPTASSPRILRQVEKILRSLGILGSAAYGLGVWLDLPGPFIVASGCAAFGGFFIATLAEIRFDTLKPRRELPIR